MTLELLAKMLIETIDEQTKVTEMSAEQYGIAGGELAKANYKASSYKTLVEFIKLELEKSVR